MNTDSILDNLNVLVEAPGGINSLRSLILNLAVTGRLVESNGTSGNGMDVINLSLELRPERKIQYKKDSPKEYHEIPSHWAWATTETLCLTQTGATPKQAYSKSRETILYITSADIKKFKATSDTSVFIGSDTGKMRIAPAGSVLFVGIGNIGKCGVTDTQATFNQQIHCATPYVMESKFLCIAYSSAYFRDECKILTSATTLPIINKSKWASIGVPVPPSAEQERIVAKVDELMALCDQLENQLQMRNKIATQYSRAVVSATST